LANTGCWSSGVIAHLDHRRVESTNLREETPVRDFLTFRKLIATYFIQVIFWLGVVGLVVVFFGAISQDQALVGLLVLIFGGLYWRILCEVFIVLFRMNNTLTSISVDTAGLSGALAGRVAEPSPGRARTEPAPIAGSGETASTDMPPKGWYEDAERPGHTRWWDGTAWGMRDDEHAASETGEAPAVTAMPVEPNAEAAPAAAGSSAPELPLAPQPEARFCENCGAARSPDGRFCTSCGHA
jgi:hypothetical protein